MHIDYEISEQDYAAAQRLALAKLRPSLARVLKFAPWFGVCILIFIVSALVQQGFSSNTLPGFVVPLLCFLLPVFSNRNIQTTYSKSTNLHGPLSLDIDDSGLQFRGRTFASDVSWKHFTRFYENKSCFIVIQQGQTVFNILPKRCLSVEQTDALREIFSRHLQAASSATA